MKFTKKLIFTAALASFAIIGTSLISAQSLDMEVGDSVVVPGYTAAQYHDQAIIFFVEANAENGVDHVDQQTWLQAISYAEQAYLMEPTNTVYLRTLGHAYHQARFWSQAFLAFTTLEKMTTLDAEALEWASMDAAKVGYIKLERGFAAQSVPYFEKSLEWFPREDIASLLVRAKAEAAVATP